MKKRKIGESYLREFKKHLVNDEKSPLTIEKYLRDLRHFCLFCKGMTVTKAVVLDYKAELSLEYKATAANSMLAAINSFFKFVGWNELCVKQFKVQRKAFCTENEELTKQEYLRLVTTAETEGNIRLSLALQTICGTGIRVSELSFVTAEGVKKGEFTVRCKNKTRRVFIVNGLRRKLLLYMAENRISAGRIFVTKNGNPLNRSNLWREMKKLCEKANVAAEKVFPHNLRHLFAVTFYKIEKDIAKLADILGHSSINTTRIYIVTDGAEHRRKMETMRLII